MMRYFQYICGQIDFSIYHIMFCPLFSIPRKKKTRFTIGDFCYNGHIIIVLIPF